MKTSKSSSPPVQGLRLRRILVPVDFSKTALRALDVAVPLARDFGARLILVSAIEPNAFATGLDGNVLAVPDAILLDDAKARLPKIARRFVPSTIPVTCVASYGSPCEIITNTAEAKNVDLIVLTTHGRTALERFLMGSTAERVVRHARCPVFVVRSFDRNRSSTSGVAGRRTRTPRNSRR